MWSVFSLLLNSSPDVLEHFIVSINGADRRTGDTSLQDNKQKFLEELRDMKWHSINNSWTPKDMPITVSRTWSRVGHPESLESALAWVHTQHYLVMHDDVILLSEQWQEEAKEFFANEKAVVKTWGNPSVNTFGEYFGKETLSMPHFNTIFSLCRQYLIRGSGAPWRGYYVRKEFDLPKESIDWYRNNTGLIAPTLQNSEPHPYKNLSLEIGAWLFVQLKTKGYEMTQFSDEILYHCEGGSHHRMRPKPGVEVFDLEKKLKLTEYWGLYNKYKTYHRATI